MKKIVLLVSALLVSVNVLAASSSYNINAAIAGTLKSHSNANLTKPLVYGGKDISRSIIATADQSPWVGQQVLIG